MPPPFLLRTLTSATRVVAISHVKPDGDAFGSTLALTHYLRNAGHNAIAVGLNPVPDNYRFLSALSTAIPTAAWQPLPGDLLAICDCSSPDRLPPDLQHHAARLPSVSIDHHKSNTGSPATTWVAPHASSTSELIWRLGQSASWPITPPIAEALWVGIVTDTGRFAYDCTSPATLECAADILRRGRLDTARINEELYENLSITRLRLQQLALASLQTAAGGRIAIISLTADDYSSCRADTSHSENFVDLARSIRGVQIAAFIYSSPDGLTSRLSLRTRPPLDAAEICATYGGGGHARAAGATINTPVPQTIQTLLHHLPRTLPCQ